MEKQKERKGIFDLRISQGTKLQIPIMFFQQCNVHMLPDVYKLYKCLHDTIKFCSLPSLYLYSKVFFFLKKNKKANYLVERTNYKGQILNYNAQK